MSLDADNRALDIGRDIYEEEDYGHEPVSGEN